MARVEVKDRIEAGIDAVWELVSDFGGVAKVMKAVESCTVEGEGIGAVRTLGMPGGLSLQERLESLDAGAHSLSYSIIGDAPLPLSDYLSTVKLTAAGDATEIEWSGTFEPKGVSEEQAQGMVQGIYTGGIAGYKQALGG